MTLGTALASAAASVLAISSTAAVAHVERSNAPVSQPSEMTSEAAPWPLLIVGIAALAALIYVLADDDDESVSA